MPVPGTTALRAVLGSAYGRGLDYVRRGRVLDVWRGSEPDSIGGRVQGTEDKPYECEITWRAGRAGQLVIDGDCSCPVGHNCKHVAAALIQAGMQLPAETTLQESRAPVAPRRSATRAGAFRTENSVPHAALDQWLRGVSEAQTSSAIKPEPDTPERLIYLLDQTPPTTHPPHATLLPATVRRRRDGSYSPAKPVVNAAASHARYIGDEDRRLLRWIEAQQAVRALPLKLDAAWGAEAMPGLLETGRCHWRSEQSHPLTRGEARPGAYAWKLGADGSSRLQLDVEGATAVLPLQPPWYVDARRNCGGVIETGLPARLAARLLIAPPLAAEDSAALAERWQQTMGEHAARVPAPPAVKVEWRRDVAPVPVLSLRRTELQQSWALAEAIDAAELFFDYAGLRCAPGGAQVPLVRVHDRIVTQVERKPKLEAAAQRRLAATLLEPMRDYYGRSTALLAPPPTIGRGGWVDFLAVEAPRLEAEGWRIEIDPDFSWRLHEPEAVWDLRVDDGGQWFDIGMDVIVEGRATPLLPLLVSLLRQSGGSLTPTTLRELADDTPMIVRDGEGRLIRLPAGRIKPILGTLLELFDDAALADDGSLRLPRMAGLLLGDLGSAGQLRYAGGEPLRELAQRLRGASSPQPVAAPQGLHAELRGYQREGVAWLQFLREYELAGVLADDMGLGKTLQALAHILIEKEAGRLDRPALVIAPTSLVFNWRREAERFAPSLKVLALHGSGRKARFDDIAGHDIVLSTYALLPRDIAALQAQRWHLLILDEAQNIKNAKSKAAQRVGELDARHRLCMTGTPLENHLGELWSLFHFLMPGYLGDERQFKRRFRTPIEKQGDAEVRTQLARRIAPFLLRRTKTQVASELPPRTEIIRSVALEGAQRDLYETVRAAMQEEVRDEIARRGLAQSQIALLTALLRLRQICCDPRLLKMQSAQGVTGSAKLELLMSLLPAMLDEGRRVLLFSQFTSMLALIEVALQARGIGYLKLTGQTQDRETQVQRFQAGEVPLFLISLKAGGVGLNLTAADTVIHYDPWWNPAVENQATDRAHRIGQDKPVFVYKLLTEGTVEAKIAELQQRKRVLAESLFGEAGGRGVTLDGDTLAELFAPLA